MASDPQQALHENPRLQVPRVREVFQKAAAADACRENKERAPSKHMIHLVPNGLGVHSGPSKHSALSPMSLAGRAHLWNFFISAVKSMRGGVVENVHAG